MSATEKGEIKRTHGATRDMPEERARGTNKGNSMKLTTDRPFADPEKAARRLMQHAHAFEVVQDGRIYIEKLNGPFCSAIKAPRRSTSQAWTTRSNTGGSNSMTGRLSASRNPGATCSHDEATRSMGRDH
jgi:hypothetical protein